MRVHYCRNYPDGHSVKSGMLPVREKKNGSISKKYKVPNVKSQAGSGLILAGNILEACRSGEG